MDMSTFGIDDRLRIFRFYGHKERFEDNVTRALLCVIKRSPSGPVILQALLQLFVEGVPIDGPLDQIREKLRRDLPRAKLTSIRPQVTLNSDEIDFDRGHALVVEINPAEVARECPTEPGQQDHSGTPQQGWIRSDGVVEFSTDMGPIRIIIEAKLYGEETNEKRQWYKGFFGDARCGVVRAPNKITKTECSSTQGRRRVS